MMTHHDLHVLETLLRIFVLLAAVATLLHCFEVVCLRMSKETKHGIRFAIVTLAGGVFAEAVAILGGHVPGLEETLTIVAIGWISMIDRRNAARCPYANRTQFPVHLPCEASDDTQHG